MYYRIIKHHKKKRLCHRNFPAAEPFLVFSVSYVNQRLCLFAVRFLFLFDFRLFGCKFLVVQNALLVECLQFFQQFLRRIIICLVLGTGLQLHAFFRLLLFPFLSASISASIAAYRLRSPNQNSTIRIMPPASVPMPIHHPGGV